MPEYLSPGVYIEEVPSGPVPIQGVSTSTAGFVGATVRGPQQVKLVTSWADFMRWYGSTTTDTATFGYLTWAVQGFFLNGGQRAFIARVTPDAATVSTLGKVADAFPDGGTAANKKNRVPYSFDPATGEPIDPSPTPFRASSKKSDAATLPKAMNTYALGLTGFPAVSAVGEGGFGNRIFVRITPASQNDRDASKDVETSGRRNWFAVSILYFSMTKKTQNWTPAADKQRMQKVQKEGDKGVLAWTNTGGVKTPDLVDQWVWVDPVDPADPDNLVDSTFQAPEASEFFDDLSPDPSDDNFFVKVINAQSKLISLDDGATAMTSLEALTKEAVIDAGVTRSPLTRYFDSLAAVPAYYRQLAGAVAETGRPETIKYQGAAPADKTPDKWTGLAALKEVREISLLSVPDAESGDALTTPLIQQCEATKSRFAVLNFKKDQPFLGLVPPIDTTYAAVYYPWLNVQDPATGEVLSVPPCGHMLGVYARTDIDRGVHKVPANEVVLGPILRDVGTKGPISTQVTRGQQDILNPKNVNCIRDFRNEGRGVRIWGGRTMSTNGQWRYINVRRLFIFVEQSIERGTQWIVFEPNDDYTWERVKSSVSGFLNTVWRNGALFGVTPQEAYFVRCGRDTMTQDDIDNGRLICEVGLAPVKPAEFVIFRFQQKTALPDA